MGGIYVIRCPQNGWSYVGEGKDPWNRWRAHMKALRDRVHHNFSLQHCYDTYGSNGLEFEVVEMVADDSERFERELHWINAQPHPMNIQTASTRLTQILKRDQEAWYSK